MQAMADLQGPPWRCVKKRGQCTVNCVGGTAGFVLCVDWNYDAIVLHVPLMSTFMAAAGRWVDVSLPQVAHRTRSELRTMGVPRMFCGSQLRNEDAMTDHVYKSVELTGSSSSGIEDAIETAVNRASKTLHNLRWFEVQDVRGGIENGKVAHWQVSLKVGFTLDDNPGA